LSNLENVLVVITVFIFFVCFANFAYYDLLGAYYFFTIPYFTSSGLDYYIIGKIVYWMLLFVATIIAFFAIDDLLFNH